MLKITKTNGKIKHKCVQCGLEMKYYIGSHNYCTICKGSQRLRTINNTTDVPLAFVLSGQFARITYHVRDTRPG